MKFVPAGKTLNSNPPDVDRKLSTWIPVWENLTIILPEINPVCAAVKVLGEIKEKNYVKEKVVIEALGKMVEIVRSVDHAEERSWPDPMSDRWEFILEMILDGLKTGYGRLQNQGSG